MGSALRPWLALVVLLTGCSADFTAFRTIPPDEGDDTEPPPPSIVSSVALGYDTSFILYGNAIYGFGSSASGQLGFTSTDPTTRPVLIDDQHVWSQVDAGSTHACALTDAGDVYCWGDNTRGQLGQGDTAARLTPAIVALPAPATRIAVNFENSCAFVGSALYCWGYNAENNLAQPTLFQDVLAPTLITPAFGARFVDVAVGQGHLCGVSETGVAQCSGRNTSGELGDPTVVGQSGTFVRVVGDSTWRALFAGQQCTCGFQTSIDPRVAQLLCWGANGSGQLGTGDIESRASPVAIGSSVWSAFDINTFHHCALSSGGALSCVGRNIEGQLGTGAYSADVLRQVPVLTDVIQVSVGRFHTCVLRSNNDLYCAGKNEIGELGLGDTERRNVFTLVPPP